MEASKQKKHAWLMLGLAVAGIAVALVLSLIVISVQTDQKEIVVRSSVLHAVAAVMERPEIAPLIDMLSGGSLGVTAEGSLAGNSFTSAGKVYFSAEQSLLLQLSATQGSTALSGNLFASGDYLYLQSPDLTDGAVGLVQGNTAEQFRASVFAHGSGSAFALPQEQSELVEQMLAAFDDDSTDALGEKAAVLFAKYAALLLSSVETHAVYEERIADLTMHGRTDAARIITVTVTPDTLVRVAKDLYAALSVDEDLADVLVALFAKKVPSLSESEIRAGWQEVLDKFGATLQTVEKNLSSGNISIDLAVVLEFVTPKRASEILRLRAYTETMHKTEEIFCLEAGWEGLADTQRLSLSLEDGATVFVFEITQNDDVAYAARCLKRTRSSDGSYTDTELLAVFVSRAANTYTLSIGQDTVVSGVFQVSGDTTVISIGELVTDGTDLFADLVLTITIDEADTMPPVVAKDEVRSVLALTETELADIVSRVLGTETPA